MCILEVVVRGTYIFYKALISCGMRLVATHVSKVIRDYYS